MDAHKARVCLCVPTSAPSSSRVEPVCCLRQTTRNRTGDWTQWLVLLFCRPQSSPNYTCSFCFTALPVTTSPRESKASKHCPLQAVCAYYSAADRFLSMFLKTDSWSIRSDYDTCMTNNIGRFICSHFFTFSEKTQILREIILKSFSVSWAGWKNTSLKFGSTNLNQVSLFVKKKKKKGTGGRR